MVAEVCVIHYRQGYTEMFSNPFDFELDDIESFTSITVSILVIVSYCSLKGEFYKWTSWSLVWKTTNT